MVNKNKILSDLSKIAVDAMSTFSGLKKEDLKNLAKPIKNKLGIGGSIKNNEIYFQGDKREKKKSGN